MYRTARMVASVSALTMALAVPVWSAGLADSIKDKAAESMGSSDKSSTTGGSSGSSGGVGSALGLPSIGGDTAGNAAGVLQYCMKNNYLGGGDAAGVKDKLLGKAGMQTEQDRQADAGYQEGLGGILSGSDGSSFDMGGLKDNLKEKACDYVLDNASSLI